MDSPTRQFVRRPDTTKGARATNPIHSRRASGPRSVLDNAPPPGQSDHSASRRRPADALHTRLDNVAPCAGRRTNRQTAPQAYAELPRFIFLFSDKCAARQGKVKFLRSNAGGGPDLLLDKQKGCGKVNRKTVVSGRWSVSSENKLFLITDHRPLTTALHS